MDLNRLVACHLDHARARTSSLLEPLDDDELVGQVSALMSPLVWDLAHIAHYEELWLLRALIGAPATDPRFDDLYDAFQHPRRERAALPILGPDAARRSARDVRGRVLDVLGRVDLDDHPLARDGFVYGMVVQHEHQHHETMLATIDLMG
ncbi:MAG TPA: DinB family protein, partial [Acidimicrobiia bacterium]|nr:DinB family protein [Acidimicrobiia bacterium]